jgi:hypothetical protein
MPRAVHSRSYGSPGARGPGIIAPVRRLAVLFAGLALLPAGVTAASATADVRFQPKLRAVASRLAHRRVPVYCWSEPGWRGLTRRLGADSAAGITRFHPLRIDISPIPCRALDEIKAVASQCRYPSYDPAFGLIVLAHESEHASGIRSEAVAECYGMQRMAETAVLLGVSRQFGQDYAIQYWSVAYQSHHDRYFTRRCRNGGPLDLRPRSNVWP